MNAIGGPGTLPASTTRHLEPGTLLVADELLRVGRTAIGCPSAVLVEGELRRRGVSTVRGPLTITSGGDSGGGAVAAVLSADDGQVGLGVAAGDPGGVAIARSALDAWLSVAGERTVLLAGPRSFCAGVERAIEVVERVLEQRDAPVYVRKQIVHNVHVVTDLEARGAVFVDELDAVPSGATVVFSAHGVSPAVHVEAEGRSLDVIDATCPLVAKVHVEARRFVARGDTVILVGHAGHEEVEGTLGEAPGRMVLVQTVADVAGLEVEDPTRVSFLTQTTLSVDEATEIVDALRVRFPSLRGPESDDICYATTNRQQALGAIAEESDLVLVFGSENSSNSRRLVELAHRYDTPAHLVDDAAGIRPEWLSGVRVIGVTAGASAPPRLVEEAISALSGLGSVTVTEREITRETVRFALPVTVR